MEHEIIETPTNVLVGLCVRVDPEDAMGTIGALWGRVLADRALDGVDGRLDAYSLLAAYTDYATDETGPYTLMVGVPVRTDAATPEGLVRRKFGAQRAASIRVRGSVPVVVQQTWAAIHTSSLERSFTVDYERYDLREMGPQTPIEFMIAVR